MPSKMKPGDTVRQGDVLVRCISEKDFAMDSTSRNFKPTQNRVLAYGEATGHHHSMVGDVEMFELGGRRYMRVKDGQLVHQEHGAIQIPEGYYVYQAPQREYVEQTAWRDVLD